MPPDQSSRLADETNAATDATESTRLRDRASTAFQKQRQAVEQRRERIATRGREFASRLDLGADSVRPVQLNDRGTEFGFVPTGEGRETLAERFAEDREFVDPDDTLVEAGPREGIETRTDPDRRADVAGEARQELAADDEFTEPGDLDVDVGPGGVTDAGLTEQGRRRRAGRELEAETPLEEVDPAADLTQADDGLGLDTAAQRRSAARGFEDDLDTFEQGSLDSDAVRETDDGFGLAREPAREAAAARIDADLPDVAVGPDDVTLEETAGGGFEANFEREVQR
jgi:hypothetical protein